MFRDDCLLMFEIIFPPEADQPQAEYTSFLIFSSIVFINIIKKLTLQLTMEVEI